MSYTLVEQVKIRLQQFHIEEIEDEATGEKSDKVVFDEKECNPLIEQLLEQARKEIIGRRNYPDTYTKDQIDSDVKNYETLWLIWQCTTGRRQEKHTWQVFPKTV